MIFEMICRLLIERTLKNQRVIGLQTKTLISYDFVQLNGVKSQSDPCALKSE